MIIHPSNSISGEITVPGDKSISHRAVMLGSIAQGLTEIDNFLMGEDCLSTIDCFRKMGVNIDILRNGKVKIKGNGLRGLVEPKNILYTGNSGTTTRLIAGILAGQPFTSILDGDESIRRRPMKRVAEPLRQMGAQIDGIDSGNFAPLTIKGGNLKGINYNSPIASAQVKSCVILAGLYAEGETIFVEPHKSRDHTELMLQSFGGNVNVEGTTVTNTPVKELYGQHVIVPGDISSAAFFITLGLIAPNSQLLIKNVGLNPTRTGILDVYTKMGANIEIQNIRRFNNEPVGDIVASTSNLKGVEISGDLIPRLIDEIPIIAVAATQAEGVTVIKDASELKVKESNRIKTVVDELKKMGADIEETDDGMIIKGSAPLTGAKVESHNDHRIAMSMSIAGKIASGETEIGNSECVNISFPGFYKILERISK